MRHTLFSLVLMVVLAMAATAGTAQAEQPPIAQAWVEMAPGGGSLARVLTTAAACPRLAVGGHTVAMRQRGAPAALPPRANKAGVATGVAFAGRVCELALPRHTPSARLAGQPLPLPRARIARIVLIGDTGCRLKDADKAWQACQDPAQWPFAAIAARAAALHPDLVLHVGDYLYRENPCPAAQGPADGGPADRGPAGQGQAGPVGCASTAWGYGEAGWRADFLAPAAPLLAAAPWAMVRGNHEECARAGQGWWRLLDPHPLRAGRDCQTPAEDAVGNHTEPYAVELGGGARLIIADFMALASGKADDPAVAATFHADMARISSLARGAQTSFLTAHYPLNAVLWAKGTPGVVSIGSKPVSAFAPPPLPHVRAMLAGHIHLFQYARFTDRPTQVITGFSGTMEDPALGPANMAEAAGKPGASTLSALTTIAGRFGYALLARTRHGWRLTAFAADGTVIGRFAL